MTYACIAPLQEKGNQNAQWWTTELQNLLGADKFVKVGLRQMSGEEIYMVPRNETWAHS